MEPLTLVIPTFNEAETIGGVIREIPVAYRLDIIVAAVGSTDGTQAVAQAAGARVIDVGRGYGRACALGAAAAHPKSTAIAFMDGDGADRGDLTGEIAQSVLDGAYDLVLASRTRGERKPGAMLWHQVITGWVTRFGIRQLYRGDLLSVRGLRTSAACNRAIDCFELNPPSMQSQLGPREHLPPP
jgi:glycosyltransferase involved in cell wall biosynthesis